MARKRKFANQNAPPDVAPKVAKKTHNRVEASELAIGTILIDYNGSEWILDSEFTQGTFGSLYHGRKVTDPDRRPYVIKIESISQGSLFQESVVYERMCKADQIQRWKQAKGLEFLGVPQFVSSGRHEAHGSKFRFLVLRKFGESLERKRLSRKSGKLPSRVVFGVAGQCLDVLEYLATNGYVHADIKAQNLVVSPENSSQFYLIDYGLSFKVPSDETYQENPKLAHEGTLIFTSADAHKGCTATFRGDAEILGYNILFWLSGQLPWAKPGLSKDAIMKGKEKFRRNLKPQLRQLLGQRRYAKFGKELIQFYRHIFNCEYMKAPDYSKLKNLLKGGL